MNETPLSRAGRTAAELLGTVEGSSYSTVEGGEPVAWAFDVAGPGHRIILAGARDLEFRIALLAPAEHAFTAMMYGKAIVSDPELALDYDTVLLLRTIPREAAWYCDSFYLTDDVLPGMGELDLLAVALHANEYGLDSDRAREAVASRARLSTPDPRANEPRFREWGLFVRALRRYRRLCELGAPAEMIERDRLRVANVASAASFAPLPDDVAAIAAELGRST